MGTVIGLVMDRAPLSEGPFVCPYCDKEYKKQDYLDKHIESKHANKVVDNSHEGEG